MVISIIAALSENRVIGYKGQIPWHIKEDLNHFWKTTEGHVVIMGRKAFENMWQYYKQTNKQLPDRQYIVVTRNNKYTSDAQISGHTRSPIIVNSIELAINSAKQMEKEEIFIAGGGQIYQQAMKYAHKLYLTIVKGNYHGDTYFPDYSEFTHVLSKDKHQDGLLEYTFLELIR